MKKSLVFFLVIISFSFPCAAQTGLADSVSLLPIANSEPVPTGQAVYEARAMLGIIKDIIIPVSSNRMYSKQSAEALPCTGTNLVFNPSFEQLLNNTSGFCTIEWANGWSNATQHSTADYFNYNINTCNPITNSGGTQAPRTGNGMAGEYTYSLLRPRTEREYIEGRLTDTLKPGKQYCVSYFVSLADNFKYSCNNTGVYFSKTYINSTDSLLPFVPQVKNNLSNVLNSKTTWMAVTDTFTATGGEKYLIIGNFEEPADLDTASAPGGLSNYTKAYYFVDDVSVVELNNPTCNAVQGGFTYTPAGPGPGVNFTDTSVYVHNRQWSFGDGTSSVLANPAHTYPAPGTYTVRLITSNWCSRDTVYKTITVVNIPCNNAQAAFTYTINGNNVSFTGSVSLNATAWSWNFGNSQISSQPNAVVTYGGPGTYTVRLIVSNACSRDTLYKIITITPVPPPCNNAQASFTYNVSGNAVSFTGSASLNATAWAWSFGNGQTSNMQNPVHTYNGPGIYNVRLVASNNCSSDTLYKMVTITPPPPPPPCNNAQALFTYTISGSTITFAGSASLNITSWKWLFGDGQSDNAQNPAHTYNAPGTYTVRLISSNACSSDTLIKNIYIAPPPPAAVVFKLYPNPAKNQIETAYDFAGTLQASLQIFSTNGQLIKEVPLNTTQQKAVIDISSLSSGIYIYKAIAGGVVKEYGKLVVAK